MVNRGIVIARLRFLRAPLFVLLLGAVFTVGCESVSFRTLEGGRYYVRGTESLDSGHLDQAIYELTMASRLVPEASEVQNHLGIAYWRISDVERARMAFETALSLDCENQAARTNLSLLRVEIERKLGQQSSSANGSKQRHEASGGPDE